MTALAAIDKFGRKWSGHPVWRYSWITPHILLGGQPAKRLIPNLDDLGFTGVINMRDEYDYKAEVGNEPLRYLRLPTPDNTPPTLDHLAQGAAFIKEELDKGGKVYIHCWEGLGRGPTMVAAYFVSTGISPADAWAKIRAVRPFVRPTPGQMQQLEAYAAQVKAGTAPQSVEEAKAQGAIIVEPNNSSSADG
jgi:protein-tyrosine phosphatase